MMRVTFPGIEQVVGCTFTDIRGMSPATATLEIRPQAFLPYMIGTLRFTHEGKTRSLYDARIDETSYTMNASGQIVSLKIWDRRWKWHVGGGRISGEYNLHHRNGNLNTDTEKTPQELASLLFEAMDEPGGFDVSDIPVDGLPTGEGHRPLVRWDSDVPHQRLADLLELLKCTVVLRLDNVFKVVKLNVGAQLPDEPWSEDSGGIDPPDLPDSIAIVFAPTRIQAPLSMKAIGLDVDGKKKPIGLLSYTPPLGWAQVPPWFEENFSDGPATQTPGVLENNPRALCGRTVFKWYELTKGLGEDFADHITTHTGIEPTEIKQLLPLHAHLIDVDPTTLIDADPTIQKQLRPAVAGVYALNDGTKRNSKPFMPYPHSFEVDQELGEVHFTEYVFTYSPAQSPLAKPIEADITLRCSFGIKDLATRSPHRYVVTTALGPTNSTGSKMVRADDYGLTLKFVYLNGTANIASVTSNKVKLDKIAEFLTQEALRAYTTEKSHQRTYRGLVLAECDGAIEQVMIWTREGAGGNTKVGRHVEVNPIVMPWRKRKKWEKMDDPQPVNWMRTIDSEREQVMHRSITTQGQPLR